MSKVLNIIITFDEPECGGAADALCEHLEREGASMKLKYPHCSELRLKSVPVLGGGSHRDAAHIVLQELFSVSHRDLLLLCLLKGDNPEEYRRVHALCSGGEANSSSSSRDETNASTQSHTMNRVQCKVITHLGNFQDVGLIIRNLVRIATEKMLSG